MKQRNGFVSNSSSSSFIIAAKPGTELTGKIWVEVDLGQYVQETFTSEEELKAWFVDEYDEDFMDYYGKEFRAALKCLQQGKEVHIGSIGTGNEPQEDLLWEEGFRDINKKIDVINDHM